MLIFTVRLTAKNFPSVRSFRKANKAAFSVMGQYWYDHFLPLHFRREARTKYNYQARGTKYERRKKALGKSSYAKRPKYGGEVDEVWSGTLEQNLKSYVNVKAYPTRATVNMTGPRYVTMRPYKSGHPNIGEEVTRVTKAEADVLVKVHDTELQRQLDDVSGFWTNPNNW